MVPADSRSTAQAELSQRVLQMVGGYTLSACIHAVTKLGVPDLLQGGARPVADLARATETNEDFLHRVLRMLSMMGVFAETAPRTFALTPLSEILRSNVPGSLRDHVLWIGSADHFRLWAELPECLRTGRTAVQILHGKGSFDYIFGAPEVAALFNAAMTAVSSRTAPALLDAYDFSGIGTLMDVAGGHGFLICEILRRYPKLKGILFDLKKVVEDPRCMVCALHLEERCRHASGDFFESIPAGADAYFMQHILHDWEDGDALRILANCRRALDGVPDGKLLIVDNVLPESPDPHPGRFMDLQMMLMVGGRERTEREFRALLARASFHLTRIVPTKVAESVLEARPV